MWLRNQLSRQASFVKYVGKLLKKLSADVFLLKMKKIGLTNFRLCQRQR